jgi:hypothetical protein
MGSMASDRNSKLSNYRYSSMKPALIFLSLFQGLIAIHVSTVFQNAPKTSLPIELRISASKLVVRETGDEAEMLLEFHNISDKDVYVGGEIAGFQNAPSMAYLKVQGNQRETEKCGIMNITLSQKAIDEWWTKIAPFHYYGTKSELNSRTCEIFGSPGVYKIAAVYVSKGGQVSAAPDCSNAPAEAWSGQIESNSIEIRFVK